MERYKSRQIEKNIETNGEYNAKVIGDYGEFKLSSILKSLPKEFHIIDNVMLKTKKGTTQIDHIIVSVHGVWVVETKNYKGRIFGDMNGKVWTQVLYNGAHNKVYSPVQQNAGHILNLSRNIKVAPERIAGVIVFTNEEVNLENVSCGYCHTIESFYNMMMEQTRVIRFTEKQVISLIKRIDKVNIDSYENRLNHIRYVKKQKGDRGR